MLPKDVWHLLSGFSSLSVLRVCMKIIVLCVAVEFLFVLFFSFLFSVVLC